MTGQPLERERSFGLSVEDAYRGFMRTEMDVLVLEHFMLEKSAQPRDAVEDDSWRAALALD